MFFHLYANHVVAMILLSTMHVWDSTNLNKKIGDYQVNKCMEMC